MPPQVFVGFLLFLSQAFEVYLILFESPIDTLELKTTLYEKGASTWQAHVVLGLWLFLLGAEIPDNIETVLHWYESYCIVYFIFKDITIIEI